MAAPVYATADFDYLDVRSPLVLVKVRQRPKQQSPLEEAKKLWATGFQSRVTEARAMMSSEAMEDVPSPTADDDD